MESFSLSFPAGLTDPLIPILYDIESMTGVETYSALEYTQIDLSLAGTYAFSSVVSMSAQAGYQIFDDGQPYVYGDQDGDTFYGSVGMVYKF